MIEQGVSLKTYNSFGVAAEAPYLPLQKPLRLTIHTQRSALLPLPGF